MWVRTEGSEKSQHPEEAPDSEDEEAVSHGRPWQEQRQDRDLDDPTMLLLGNEEALTNAVKIAPDGRHLPVIDELVTKLQRLYREYAEFRRRPYALVTWSTAEARPWASARVDFEPSE